jgi:hypothetical protein
MLILAITLIVIVRHSLEPTNDSAAWGKNNRTSSSRFDTANPSNEKPGPARTRSQIRTIHPRPTIEETTALLRNTTIPVMDLPPDQPLEERVAQINLLIQKAGVESQRLRLVLSRSDPASQWRMKNELKIKNSPMALCLKHLCGRSKLRYQVRENGIVELATIPPPESIPPPSVENDSSPSEEDDPFAETVN